MNVSIAVPGKFHAFKLGRKLEKNGSLHKIYTTYPSFALGETSVDSRKITNIRHPEFVYQLGKRVPLMKRVPSKWNHPHERWKMTLFDRAVARKLSPTSEGLFVGFAGVSLKSLERANELGYTTVVERASTHIRTQKQILDQQEDRKNELSPISEAHLNREEEEYHVADYVMTPSDVAKKSFIDNGFDEDRVYCVPYGISSELSVTSKQSSDDEFIFLFCGAVSLQKGVPDLLQAWDSLSSIDAKLVFLGEVEDELEDLVEKYSERDDVYFEGWTDDVNYWYRRASVFVFPSHQEGSAMVTYEAMAAGLPLVTTFRSGWVGTDGEHGIEVPVEDSTALAHAMVKLRNNPSLCKDMGASARNLILSEYTEEDYGQRVIYAYNTMLSGSKVQD